MLGKFSLECFDSLSDSAISVDDSVDDAQSTQLASVSILERLRETGRFDADQLALIHRELQRYFDDEGLSLNDLRIGMAVGEYILVSLLGEGGAGHVYRARSKQDASEHVALKLIKHARSTDRFRREMELVLRLAHPNVVVAYEAGEHRNTLFIVMEELAGPDLQQQVADSGPISWQQSVRFISDAASGLEHAHQRGLIHRDVKPGNLMLDSGRLKVTDLGLAILTEDGDTDSGDSDEEFHTHNEILGGTPDYMSPEQARSLKSATVQSDIYSLGASWYYLLTGKTRVSGESMREKVVSLIRGVGLKGLDEEVAPQNVREIIEKMVAYRPQDRYRSMADVITALQGLELAQVRGTQRSCIEVLIVEDDQDDMFLAIEMLQRGNKAVSVCPVHTLGEAIQSVPEKRGIDLVLLDLQLPDSQGVDTVTSLRKVMPVVPIIVLTGQDDVTVGQACIAAGADDFACKNDLTPHLLERIIFVTLSRTSRRQQPANENSLEVIE